MYLDKAVAIFGIINEDLLSIERVKVKNLGVQVNSKYLGIVQCLTLWGMDITLSNSLLKIGGSGLTS